MSDLVDWIRAKQQVEVDARRLHHLAAAYVGENPHPDCHPAYRYHAIMPDRRRYYPTRAEALAAVLALGDPEAKPIAKSSRIAQDATTGDRLTDHTLDRADAK